VKPLRSTTVGLIIFDFDRVVVDSEALANQLLAEGLSEIGLTSGQRHRWRAYLRRAGLERKAVQRGCQDKSAMAQSPLPAR
jgi:beta-phosphoglucomutase-like phosphatase (HAD superfamily)